MGRTDGTVPFPVPGCMAALCQSPEVLSIVLRYRNSTLERGSLGIGLVAGG